MDLPSLARDDVYKLVPGIASIGEPRKGGQKLVFPCSIRGQRYALKVMLVDTRCDDMDGDFDEVTARARREVDIMTKCDTSHIVKLGPVPLTQAEIRGQHIIYFTEEWIDGYDLRAIINHHGPLPVAEVAQLGTDIAKAVKSLWSLKKIHRDIKPGNIMRRESTGNFLLLDMGLAFDTIGDTLTSFGLICGTPQYFSPEQTEFSRKRQMDFRSDLFSLGVTLYEAATGYHPFWSVGTTTREVIADILQSNPKPPSDLRSELPSDLDIVIMRLLEKSPHLRYRTCDRLIEALAAISA